MKRFWLRVYKFFFSGNPYLFFGFLIIVTITIVLRFYNFTGRVIIHFDSTKDAFVAIDGANHLQLPLSGPFLSIGPMVTGPWYWIQLIISRLVIPTNYAPWILMATYSSLTVVTMFAIGVLLVNPVFGLIVCFLASVSPPQIFNGVYLLSHTVISFFATLMVLLFLILARNPRERLMYFIWGVVASLMVTIHYQTVGLLMLPLIFYLIYRPHLKLAKYFLIGGFFPTIPLLIFELNNFWYNTRHFYQYLRYDQFLIYVPNRWTTFILNFLPESLTYITGLSVMISRLVLLTIAIIFCVLAVKRKLDKRWLILSLTLLVQLIILRYYRGEKTPGYLQFLHPLIFLFLAVPYLLFKQSKYQSVILLLILTVFLISTYQTISNSLTPHWLTSETYANLTKIYELKPAPAYRIFSCGYPNDPRVGALAIGLYLQNRYDVGGLPLAFNAGACKLPKTQLTTKSETELFPQVLQLTDFSVASAAAIREAGWQEINAQNTYQSVVRWWMDEQPYSIHATAWKIAE